MFLNKLKDDSNLETILYEGHFDFVSKMLELYRIHNIDEVPSEERVNLLKGLLSFKHTRFETSDALRKAFPLAPRNDDEYRELVLGLAKIIG